MRQFKALKVPDLFTRYFPKGGIDRRSSIRQMRAVLEGADLSSILVPVHLDDIKWGWEQFSEMMGARSVRDIVEYKTLALSGGVGVRFVMFESENGAEFNYMIAEKLFVHDDGRWHQDPREDRVVYLNQAQLDNVLALGALPQPPLVSDEEVHLYVDGYNASLRAKYGNMRVVTANFFDPHIRFGLEALKRAGKI